MSSALTVWMMQLNRNKPHQIRILSLTDLVGISLLTWKAKTELVALLSSMISVSEITSSYALVIIGNLELFAHPRCEYSVKVGV